MKVEVKQNPAIFQPVIMTITLDSLEDVRKWRDTMGKTSEGQTPGAQGIWDSLGRIWEGF